MDSHSFVAVYALLNQAHNFHQSIIKEIKSIGFSHLSLLGLEDNDLVSVEELPRVHLPELKYLGLSN